MFTFSSLTLGEKRRDELVDERKTIERLIEFNIASSYRVGGLMRISAELSNLLEIGMKDDCTDHSPIVWADSGANARSRRILSGIFFPASAANLIPDEQRTPPVLLGALKDAVAHAASAVDEGFTPIIRREAGADPKGFFATTRVLSKMDDAQRKRLLTHHLGNL